MAAATWAGDTMAWAKSTTTKHTHPVIFGRRVVDCPRCIELANGAKPIQWSGARKDELEAEQIRAIRAHDCVTSHCGPVCTFGDW